MPQLTVFASVCKEWNRSVSAVVQCHNMLDFRHLWLCSQTRNIVSFWVHEPVTDRFRFHADLIPDLRLLIIRSPVQRCRLVYTKRAWYADLFCFPQQKLLLLTFQCFHVLSSSKLCSASLPAMDHFKPSSLCSEETSSWHSAFEPTSDKPTSSSTTVGSLDNKSHKGAKSKRVGKSKHKKDVKKHKKSSKRKKKRKKSSHSSQADPSPISTSELLEGSCTVSPMLGDPMQFHRPLPIGRACAKMLVRARYR